MSTSSFGELLAEVGHAVYVLIGHIECLQELLLGVGVLHITSHHGKKLGEIDGAGVTIHVTLGVT